MNMDLTDTILGPAVQKTRLILLITAFVAVAVPVLLGGIVLFGGDRQLIKIAFIVAIAVGAVWCVVCFKTVFDLKDVVDYYERNKFYD